MINVDYVIRMMDEHYMSQKILAVSMHMSESCVSRILSGQRSGSLAFLEGLARAFPDEDLRSFLKEDDSAKAVSLQQEQEGVRDEDQKSH